MAPLCDLSNVNPDGKTFTIRWVDEAHKDGYLAVENADEEDLVNLNNPPMIKNHRTTYHNLRSNIKGKRQLHQQARQSNH